VRTGVSASSIFSQIHLGANRKFDVHEEDDQSEKTIIQPTPSVFPQVNFGAERKSDVREEEKRLEGADIQLLPHRSCAE